MAENARPVWPAIRGECQTIVINLGSTPPSGVEAGDFLIFSFLVNNLLLRWDKPAEGAPESAHNQKGESPFRAYALRPVAYYNCVVVRRGGRQ